VAVALVGVEAVDQAAARAQAVQVESPCLYQCQFLCRHLKSKGNVSFNMNVTLVANAKPVSINARTGVRQLPILKLLANLVLRFDLMAGLIPMILTPFVAVGSVHENRNLE
jgi:hypothetical protein